MLRTNHFDGIAVVYNEPAPAKILRELFGESYPRVYEEYIDWVLYDVAVYRFTDTLPVCLRREKTELASRDLRRRECKRFCALSVDVLVQYHRADANIWRGDRALQARVAVLIHELVVNPDDDKRSYHKAARWKGFAEYVDEIRAGKFDAPVRQALRARLDQLAKGFPGE